MGCDIHPAVERMNEDGSWEVVMPVDDDNRYAKYRQPGEPSTCQWTFGRDYDSFALMANVRNYGNTAPIAEPRGLPKDVTPEVAEELPDDGDLHSHSWLMLPEILEVLKPKNKIKQAGIVGEGTFKEYLETGKPPDSYCQGIGGSNIVIVSAQEMKKILKNDKLRHVQMTYHVKMEWEAPLMENVYNLVEFVKRLKKLGDPERIRIVFAFDN